MSENVKRSTWIELFFNPLVFIKNNWIIKFDRILIIFILIFAGTSSSFDNIIRKLVDFNVLTSIETEIADRALFSWWIYWLYIICNSIISGITIWFIGGWWFNIRLKFSGDNNCDIKKCRFISIYMNMIKSIPLFSLILILNLFFPNIYIAYSNICIKSLYTFIFYGMMIVLIYFEYSVAVERFSVDKKKVKIWFIYIPSVFFFITISLLIYGIVK